MIKNQQQYRVTRAQLRRLEQALERARAAETNPRPALGEAVIAGLEAQIGELQEEMEEYDSLKDRNVLVAGTLQELPQVLIKARIARGWTQEQLARKLKLKAQQIQRYESTDYRTVSFGRLLGIAAALNIELERCETRLTDQPPSWGRVSDPPLHVRFGPARKLSRGCFNTNRVFLTRADVM